MNSTGYTVKTIGGCKVVTGSVPLSDMGALLKMLPEGAVIDARAAKHLGAVIVAGMPEDTKKLLNLPACDELKEQAREASSIGLSVHAARWLLEGERGSSSETIFFTLSGQKIKNGCLSYPHDLDDLKRCRLLLEQVPEFSPRILEMAAVSPEWTRLVSRWDEICRTMDSECPNWRDGNGSAKQTYAMMRECIEGTA